MAFRARLRGRLSPVAGMKLARLLEAPEEAIARQVERFERSPLFSRLVALGVVRVERYAAARFAARRFAGYSLRTTDSGLSNGIDAGSSEVRLIVRIGHDLFRSAFLSDERRSDKDRADLCGISEPEARLLREFVDRLYVQGEFSGTIDAPAPTETYSSVAGFRMEDGKPVLAFFNREIWKGGYRIDADRREDFMRAMRPHEARKADALLRELEFVEKRKSTLYRSLEILLEEQADYLASGNRDRRRPFSQRELAERLGVCPSVISRMISNKAVELPWGVDVPLRQLFPSRKEILSAHVLDIKAELPTLSDSGIREEIRRRYGVLLSRSSILQYRMSYRTLALDRGRTLETCGAQA